MPLVPSTSKRTVDRGTGGKYEIITKRTPNTTGGMDVEETTNTLVPPEQSKQEEEFTSSGNTTLVETLLLLLIIVNGFTSGQFKGLWGLMTLKNAANPQQFRQGFIVLGGELVALIALSLVAKSSDNAKKIVLFLVGALWLGWFMHNSANISAFTAKVQPHKGPINITGGNTTKS